MTARDIIQLENHLIHLYCNHKLPVVPRYSLLLPSWQCEPHSE